MLNSPSLFWALVLIVLWGCNSETATNTNLSSENVGKVVPFESKNVEHTGVSFSNNLDPLKMRSHYEYINVYNGGGVAIGDINNDGLEDIYFTGSQVGNKLYLNKGNFQFEDITKSAGVGLEDAWSNGTTVTDINDDGWLDIYVCCAYFDNPDQRRNKVFMNMKDGTFKEIGQYLGIDDPNYSLCASFFDYDQDGDNDLFVGNHPPSRNGDLMKSWKNPTIENSDRLYRNDGGMKFTDVTEEAGIVNFGWTLGAITADFNNDQLADIYVAVDHDQPDRLYINQGDGTFKEEIKKYFGHTSFSSMGIDVGDINNDGHLDLYALDMLSKDNFREKTNMGSMNVDLFNEQLAAGYHYQAMRNVLQLNRGNGYYSEVGQMANVHRTEWSWAALLMDFDNNGLDDIFVTNGYYKDILNKDWAKAFRKRHLKEGGKKSDFDRIFPEELAKVESSPYKNELYMNQGQLQFKEMAGELGLDKLGFSSGAAYGDLDNDGDLDLVVNNIDEPANVYENKAEKTGYNQVSFELEGYINQDPQGTYITLSLGDSKKSKIYLRSRGYASSMGKTVHFGIGEKNAVEEVWVLWPNGKSQQIKNVEVNKINKITYDPTAPQKAAVPPTLFADVSNKIQIEQKENDFDDYDVQVLLPHKMSTFGPIVSKADFNGDQREDVFIGGPSGTSGKIYLQSEDGSLELHNQEALEQDRQHEDMGSVFIDADADGDMDLYVVSGGNELEPESDYYLDRYYENVNGQLKRNLEAIPEIRTSGGRVISHDFDQDGDIDLFVCGKQTPHHYPKPTSSYLLVNNGQGQFEVGNDRCADWNEMGMCADAVFTDVDNDGDADLIAVGDWMPIRIFKQENGRFVDATADFGLENTVGWWNRIIAEDLDGDGREDYVVGNLGENYKYKVEEGRPFHVFADDFDRNGTFDIAFAYYLTGETLFPVRGKQCSSEQVPDIAKKFPTYDAFGKASIFEVYGERLERGLHYEAKLFSHVMIDNKENGLTVKRLPYLSQISPVFGISVNDYDQDGNKDILLAGNLYVSEVETGRADASIGLMLRGDGQNNFSIIPATESGLIADRDVRDLIDLKTTDGSLILVSRNDDQFGVYKTRTTVQ